MTGSEKERTLNVNISAPHVCSLEKNRWMTCHFLSFSTVCQSYQDNGQVIMKVFVQRNCIYGLEDFALNGARTGTARSVASA